MGLSGAIGDAWEYWRMSGKRGYPGSCALKAPPIRMGTSGRAGLVLVVLLLRDERCSVLVVLLLSPVVTTVALE
jgi:hypothetical protein